MNDLDVFLKLLTDLVQEHKAFNLLFTKPRIKGGFVKSDLSINEDAYTLTSYTKTQSFTKPLSEEEVIQTSKELLENDFLFSELFTPEFHYSLLQSKKGKSKLIKKLNSKKNIKATHNRTKKYLIAEDSPFLNALGLTGSNKKILAPAQKKYRQINRFVELVDHFIDSKDKKLSIVDMGCGKAYLTFALHDVLKRKGVDVHSIGVDVRPELMKLCNGISKDLNYPKLSFEVGNILDYKIKDASIVIALHACDIATDMAIKAGIEAEAKYIIVAPCCHKQIRKQMKLKNSITKHGIFLERQAEIVTDTMRALLLEHMGYKTNIIEFISSEHTNKNIMLLAKKTKRNPSAMGNFLALKKEYGIEYHYLEKLMMP